MIRIRHTAAALAALIADPRLRQHFGASGRLLYEAQFRLETMIEGTVAVYDQALNNTDAGN